MSEQNLADFSVGDVLSKSFSTLFRNVIPFSAIGMIIYLPFFLATFWLGNETQISNPQLDLEIVYLWLGSLLFLFIFIFVAYGAVTFGTIRDLQGRPATFGQIISKGFSRFFPLIGVAIVSTIAVGLGFILFVIPGFIVAMVIYVAVPATVVEKVGVFEALSRSADLTRGFRWKIFGLYLMVLLINIVAGIIIGIFSLAGTLISSIVDVGANSVSLAFGAVVAAVAYQELRRVKEGVDIDSIASVFA